MTTMSILGRPLFEDKHVKEYLLLGEDELQRVIEQQKGGGKQGDMKERYHSANDKTITEKTYMNSEEEEDFPLAKQLDKWKGMDRDHVLKAFREYVIMNRWVKDFLRKGSPLPNNLDLQDILKYLRKITKKYKSQFIELGLIGYKNVKPQTTPQFREIGVGTNKPTGMKTIGVGSSPIPSTSKHMYSSSSASSSGSSTPTHKWVEDEDEWKDVLDSINEFNKEQANKGKKKFVTESDISNAGQAWLSGAPAKEFGLEWSDDDDDEFYSMPPQKGSGRKRVLDEEDYYPFPVFNKKWVKVE